MRNKGIVPTWIEGATSFLFYSTLKDGQEQYFLVNAETGEQELLIRDIPDFVHQYRVLTADTTLRVDSLKMYGLKIKQEDRSLFYWNVRGRRLVYNRKTGLLTNDTAHTTPPIQNKGMWKHASQTGNTEDSLYTMLGDRYNLYVRNNVTGDVRQLTTDGKEYASYCNKGAKDSLLAGNAHGRWIGHIYMCTMYDDSEVGELYIINALAKNRPKLQTKKMPLPGEKGIRRCRVFWYNADTMEGHLLPIDRFQDQSIQFQYEPIKDDLYFLCQNRAVDSVELCRLHIPTGQIQTVITETCKPHFNKSLFNYRLLDNGHEILWWSERTGRGNYYLYDTDGQLKHRITQGDSLVAGRIERIDTLQRQIIFMGYGQEKNINPYYAYYYKASLDGQYQVSLCKGDGTHEIDFNSDGRFIIDQYSRMDMPMHYDVVSVEHPEQRYEVYAQSEESYRRAGWRPPVLIKVKAADEKTDLYGVMYLPSKMKKSRKYPVISNVYPGPQDDQVPRAFAIDDNGNQSLAEMGFVVVNVAPRGSSPLRGKDFYCFGYGNLRDYPLADDKHTLETLAHKYKFIDLNRVGIYGHSGGGFMAASAMLSYPEFYKVAVAASGNYDNNIYIQWWGELFHGLTEPGKIPTTMELAKNLKGKLLLVSGDVDGNVPYASTLRLADELIKCNKRFDMMILPGKDHSVWSPYYLNLVRYYFLENLKGSVSHDVDIVNHR